jgi:hypothetical protein
MKNSLRFIIILLLFLISIIILCSNITIFHGDPLNGFLALKGTLLDGEINMVTHYSLLDLDNPNYSYLTWWSPGQYVIPHVISSLFGLSFIMGIKLTIILSIISIIFGTYYLYKSFGFDYNVTLITIILIILQRGIAINLWGYDGGDILLTGFFPWLMVVFIHYIKDPVNVFKALLLGLFILVAIFLKLSAIVIVCAIIIVPFFKEYDGKLNLEYIKKNLKYSPIFIITSLVFLLVYVFFISKGNTPNSFLGFTFNSIDTLGVFEMPLAIFNLDLISIYVKKLNTYYFILSNVFFIVLSYIIIVKLYKSERSIYKDVAYAFLLFFGVYFLYAFNFATVSGNSRHLRYVSIIFLPYIIYTVTSKGNLFIKCSFISLILVSTSYSFYSLIKYKMETINNPVLGKKGFDFHTVRGALPKKLIDYVHKLDEENESIFFSSSLHICLDLPGNNYGFLSSEFYSELELFTFSRHKYLYLICSSQEFQENLNLARKDIYFRKIKTVGDYEIIKIEQL